MTVLRLVLSELLSYKIKNTQLLVFTECDKDKRKLIVNSLQTTF